MPRGSSSRVDFFVNLPLLAFVCVMVASQSFDALNKARSVCIFQGVAGIATEPHIWPLS